MMDDDVNRPPFFTRPQEYVGATPKKTLFLDMDETLVYCYLGRPKFFRENDDHFHAFRLAEEPEVEYCAFKRPGVDRFLRRCEEHYELYILTAGDELYATTLLKWLVPGIDRRRWHCRGACQQTLNGVRYKDLAAIPGVEFNERSTFILDDSAPTNIVPQSNGISLPRFAPQVGRTDDENYERMSRDSALEIFGSMLCGHRFLQCSDIRVPIAEYMRLVESSTRSTTSR